MKCIFDEGWGVLGNNEDHWGDVLVWGAFFITSVYIVDFKATFFQVSTLVDYFTP